MTPLEALMSVPYFSSCLVAFFSQASNGVNPFERPLSRCNFCDYVQPTYRLSALTG